MSIDNPSAFPHGSSEFNYDESSGMTLRDYFAAKAMQTILGVGATDDIAVIAKAAYETADAMLAERAK